MITDEVLEGVLDWPTTNDVGRLVAEVRRQRREIAHLRGALEQVAHAAEQGHGPHWIEEYARGALQKDFRTE